MADTLVPLVVGFLLTTVFGGLLASYLQSRTWHNQEQARLREDELRRADAVCRSLACLLDKRLYRMLRLFHATRALAEGHGSRETAAKRLHDYDAVLYEWNDQLNLNLALVGTYFGETGRDWLDHRIYESFKRLGDVLERRYRAAVAGTAPPLHDEDVEAAFASLNDEVYRLGVFMMTQLRGGSVGRTAPRPVEKQPSPSEVTSRVGIPG
jgi:hypothetical protein